MCNEKVTSSRIVDDDDIYIMVECICVCNEKVTSSWIVGDDDIYIMTECICVCNEKVTTSWIVDDDDIYMPKLPRLSLSLSPLTVRRVTAASWQRHQLKANYNHNECLLS